MKKIKTLTIGVPAYNEEKNISNLLDSIIEQEENGFRLKNVIVICDGSKDRTARIALEYKKRFSFIRIVDGGKRMGKAKRLNRLYKTNSSDIILIFDGDVILGHRNVISEIVKKFDNPKVGLVGGCNLPLSPRNFFERIINTWLYIWFDIRRNLNKGISVHNNLGCVSALSREFAKKVEIPNNLIPDDDFTYFTALKCGYKFKFAEKAVVFYRSVDNINDFFVQHSRLLRSKRFVSKHFGDWVNDHYQTPLHLKLMAIGKSLFFNPLPTSLAVIFQLMLRRGIAVPKENYRGGYWKIAVSSKLLV